MLGVFLVEDESIIRETLRDTVPWTQYGYTFVGEAGDGELALPLIRRNETGSSDNRYSYAIHGWSCTEQDGSAGISSDEGNHYFGI